MARSTNLESAVAQQVAATGSYNNGSSGLTATTIQGAIDEVEGRVDTLEAEPAVDYVDINSTGTAASATGNDSIAIGESASTIGTNAIAIGRGAQGNFGDAIAIGDTALASQSAAIAIGNGASATVNDAIGIGNGADALALNAVQIGTGNNNTASTLQYFTNRLANAEGLYTAHSAVNYSPADADNVTSHIAAIDGAIGTLNSLTSGGVQYKGGYDAEHDFPALDGQTRTLTGTAALDDTVNVVGTGTLFLTEIAVGDTITIAGEARIVNGITDDLNLDVTVAFTAGTVSGQTITKDAVIISGILTGDMYTVCCPGTIYGETLENGDVLIAEADAPAALTDWTRVNRNIDGTFDYLQVNSTGTLASATGTDAISIGETSTATATNSIAIGNGADSTIVSGIAIGTSSDASGGAGAVAIGLNAICTVTNSIQLGPGTNSTSGTVQFQGATLANATGLLTGHTAVNYVAGTSNVDTHLSGIDTALGTALAEDYVLVNSTGTAPVASGTDAIAIGEGASTTLTSIVIGPVATSAANQAIALGNTVSADSFRSTAIGASADVTSGSDNSVALGYNATVSSAANAVQLGNGTNSTASTLQYLTNTLANASGLVTGHTAVNYTAGDTNVDTHLSGIDTELANKQDTLPQAATVNRETITVNKTLLVGDEIYQHIITTTASLLVNLPGSPVNGTRFVIKNSAGSTQSFTTNSIVIAPGELYEAVYDGTEWVAL